MGLRSVDDVLHFEIGHRRCRRSVTWGSHIEKQFELVTWGGNRDRGSRLQGGGLQDRLNGEWDAAGVARYMLRSFSVADQRTLFNLEAVKGERQFVVSRGEEQCRAGVSGIQRDDFPGSRRIEHILRAEGQGRTFVQNDEGILIYCLPALGSERFDDFVSHRNPDFYQAIPACRGLWAGAGVSATRGQQEQR